jgi:predicted TIM-barrel fold metal-dependent hydrolase
MPLIDAHNHLNGNIPAESLIEAMDRAGVESMVLMPRHYRNPGAGGAATDEQALEYARRYPGRFVPFVGGQRDELLQGRIDQTGNVNFVLRELGDELKKGEYRGLGEFILVHHAYGAVSGGEGGGEVRIRVDHDAMRRIAALAAKQRLPVVFHAEAEEQPAKEAEALIAAHPDTLFIWAHACGRASADETARRLRRFPNLMCDFGSMSNGPLSQAGYGRQWPRESPWIHQVQDNTGRVVPEMKRVLETFPDRFMIGTDVAHTGQLKTYRYRVDLFRIMLAQLAPEAASKIGAENARRVFAKSAARQ